MAPAERPRRNRGQTPVALGSRLLLGAGGLLLVAAVVFLVAGLAGAGGDDDDEPDRSPAQPGTILDSPRFGITLHVPEGWEEVESGRAIRLASPGRRVVLSLTTAASEPATERVARQLEASLREGYRDVRVLERGRGRIGGRPARVAALTARNEDGAQIDVLAGAVASRWRTYAVLTFGSSRAPQPVLRQARAVLQSLEFRRPGRAG